MLLTIGYVGVILFLTSRRSQVTRSTLAIGAGMGLLFGVVMFAVAPLGLNKWATDPWLPGSTADPLVALAWVLLFGGPAAAAVLAARRCRRPDGTKPPYTVRIGQGIAAGVLANGTAALFTAALGTGTVALTLKSAWLLHWLNHGQQLTAVVAYRYEIYAGTGAFAYVVMLIFFPVIGLIMSSVAAAIANPAPCQPGPRTDGDGGPPSPGRRVRAVTLPPAVLLADAEDRIPAFHDRGQFRSPRPGPRGTSQDPGQPSPPYVHQELPSPPPAARQSG